MLLRALYLALQELLSKAKHPKGDPWKLSRPNTKVDLLVGPDDLDDRDDAADLVVVAEVCFDGVHLARHFLHEPCPRVKLLVFISRVSASDACHLQPPNRTKARHHANHRNPGTSGREHVAALALDALAASSPASSRPWRCRPPRRQHPTVPSAS